MCGHCEDPWSPPFLPGTILCQGFSICRFSPAPSASGSFSEGRLSTVRETSALRLRTALLDPMVSVSPGVQAGQAGVSDCLSPRQALAGSVRAPGKTCRGNAILCCARAYCAHQGLQANLPLCCGRFEWSLPEPIIFPAVDVA